MLCPGPGSFFAKRRLFEACDFAQRGHVQFATDVYHGFDQPIRSSRYDRQFGVSYCEFCGLGGVCDAVADSLCGHQCGPSLTFFVNRRSGSPHFAVHRASVSELLGRRSTAHDLCGLTVTARHEASTAQQSLFVVRHYLVPIVERLPRHAPCFCFDQGEQSPRECSARRLRSFFSFPRLESDDVANCHSS